MAVTSVIAVTKFSREPSGALENTAQFTDKTGNSGKEGANFVPALRDLTTRRPLRGLQIKKDTPATLAVLGPSGIGTSIHNSSVGGDTKASFTTNFIVQSFNISRAEKMQLVQTFGATYGFFFGEQPYFVQVQALLVDSEDFPWVAEWWANYDEFFRGTKLVDRGLQVFFEVEDFVFGGYLSTAQLGKSAGEQHQVPISFSMWITSVDMSVAATGRGLADYESGQGGWEPFNLAPTDSTTGDEVPSSSAQVRQANLTQGVAFSLIGFLRGLADTGEGFINSRVAQGRNLLYGRDIRIPAGFAGSEINAGAATFASGSGEEAVIARGNFVTVRLPPEFTAYRAPPRRSDFFDNIDEYPLRGAGGAYSEQRIKDDFDRTFTGLGGGASSADEGGGHLREQDIISLTEMKWRQAGFPLVTNANGGGVPELGLAAARIAFGVLSWGASMAMQELRTNAAEAEAVARANGTTTTTRGQRAAGEQAASILGLGR